MRLCNEKYVREGLNARSAANLLEGMFDVDDLFGEMVKQLFKRLFEQKLNWGAGYGADNNSAMFMTSVRDGDGIGYDGYVSASNKMIDGKAVRTSMIASLGIEDNDHIIILTADTAGVGRQYIAPEQIWVFFKKRYTDKGYLYIPSGEGEYLTVEETVNVMGSSPENVIGTVSKDEFLGAIISREDEKLATCTFASFQKSTSDTRGRI